VRILIYRNPDAGHERTLPDAIVETLQRTGHELVWKTIKEYRLGDSEAEYDLIVAAGGDGSVGRTARQLVGKPTPIAVLPMGTANNLASILDSGKHDLVDRIAEWAIVPFDAGTVDWGAEPDWFFEGFGIGAFAETAAKLTAMARAGATEGSRDAELARDIAALRDQARAQSPIEVDVHLDGKVVHAPVLMLEVLNIGLIGPNVQLAAGVDPWDGELDVVLVGENQRDDLIAYLEALAGGRDPDPPFKAARARDVRVRLPSLTCAHIDGRSHDVPGPADVRLGIRPGAVRFLGGTSG
jgi:diacylglycerol kinase family enzyme